MTHGDFKFVGCILSILIKIQNLSTLTLVESESCRVGFRGVHIGGLGGDCNVRVIISKFSTHVCRRAMFCVPFLLQQALQQRVEFFLCVLRYKMIPTNDFLEAIICYFLFLFWIKKMLFQQKVERITLIPQKN